jgi:osmoprotectant transport system ATP-binding protein
LIAFEGVSVEFGGARRRVLHDVSLHVDAGALCVLVGPSGSGKSTLMRLVNRLVAPTTGTVRVRGKDVRTLDPAPLRRSIGYAIQSVGHFPHRTVAENIGTVPRLLGWERGRIAARVEELLALVRLESGLAGRYPAELSGGQAQRVGLARALAADPDILLMDEPFGAVDPIARRELRAELRRIHAGTGKTVLLVTHDPGEALELATHLAVLRDGRVVASGSALELLAAPVDGFVRELVGGGDLGLRRLGLLPVRAAVEAEPPPPDAPAIGEAATLLEALSRMVEERCGVLAVRSEGGGGGEASVGSVSLRALVERHP